MTVVAAQAAGPLTAQAGEVRAVGGDLVGAEGLQAKRRAPGRLGWSVK